MADLDRLKDLLLDDERAERRKSLGEMQDGIAQKFSGLHEELPELLRRAQDDERLARSLEKPLADTLMRLARNQKQLLVALLYPIIGPVIRRSIAETLSQLIKDMNRALEHSVSPTGLKWRWESIRTGVPFAQVVMRHTLRYRIEHLLLVNNQGGLLLAHVANANSELADSDAVAGMLSALQDFARDSVLAGGEEELNSVVVGGMTLRIVRGGYMHLAIAVRGELSQAAAQAGVELIERLHSSEVLSDESQIDDALEVHREEFAAEMRDWLLKHGQQSSGQAKPEQSSQTMAKWVLATFLSLLIVWIAWQIKQSQDLQASANALREALNSSPGISAEVLIEDGKIIVSGSRDPLARSARAIIKERGLDANQVQLLTMDMRISLAPELWAKRLRRNSQVPGTVGVRVQGEGLLLQGEASRVQLEQLRQLIGIWQDFVRIDMSAVQVIEGHLLEQRLAKIRQLQTKTFAWPLSEQDQTELSADLDAIEKLSESQRLELHVLLQTDVDQRQALESWKVQLLRTNPELTVNLAWRKLSASASERSSDARLWVTQLHLRSLDTLEPSKAK